MKYQLHKQIFFQVKRKFHITIASCNKASPLIDSIIRVDHAGELGADRIYAGQMAVLGNSKIAPNIQHMWDQEKHHKETFEKLILKHRVRPTALMPLWNVAGFLLGAGTALLGEKAAMACTVAVESVIVEHYNDQLRTLMSEPEKNTELLETIKKFRDEEQEHHDQGIEHGAEQAPFYTALSEVIKFGCKQAIAISKGFLSQSRQFDLCINRKYCTSNQPQVKSKWDLFSGICLERKPVIQKPLNELEKSVLKTLMEIEDEQSYKSDHEIQMEEDYKEAVLLKTMDAKNVDLENITKQTAQDFEDRNSKELSNFKPAPLTTESDAKNDVKSLRRKLSSHLLFVVNEELGDKRHWILPQGIRKGSETLRETAERVLKEKCGDTLNVLFLGNAPCGFYKYKYPKNGNFDSVGAKVFYFKALYLNGNIEGNDSLDYQWATRPELVKLFNNSNYFKKISMFLIDEDDEI